MKFINAMIVMALLTMKVCGAVGPTTEDRAWLKQQENLSEQLRQHPDRQLQQELEAQIKRNPLNRSDSQFIDNLLSQQKAANQEKPTEGALYFVSFSIPEEGLKRMLHETRQYGIPATLYAQYNIRSVPALVVRCQTGFDVVRGNIRLKQALEKVAETGDCAQTARTMLGGIR